MKYLKSTILGLSMLTSSALAGVDTGSPAPDFTLSDTAGAEHSLADFKGKYVVLEWTNHQCPFVRKHYDDGHMQKLQADMTDQGVVWLQIISSAEGKQGYVTATEGEAIRKEKNIKATATLLDPSGEVGRRYSAKTTPHMFLINPDGVLVYQGAIDSIKSTRSSDVVKAKNYLKEAYASAIAGKQIVDSSTTPYGCGIKY